LFEATTIKKIAKKFSPIANAKHPVEVYYGFPLKERETLL
jgi:hypothetical protein